MELARRDQILNEAVSHFMLMLWERYESISSFPEMGK